MFAHTRTRSRTQSYPGSISSETQVQDARKCPLARGTTHAFAPAHTHKEEEEESNNSGDAQKC